MDSIQKLTNINYFVPSDINTSAVVNPCDYSRYNMAQFSEFMTNTFNSLFQTLRENNANLCSEIVAIKKENEELRKIIESYNARISCRDSEISTARLGVMKLKERIKELEQAN